MAELKYPLSPKKKVKLSILFVLLVGLLIPQRFEMPVERANKSDYNQASFWYHPWGKSGTHKGVDIFANKGTTLNSSVSGIVLYTGQVQAGGNVVVTLGPKWRIHYFAHLDEVATTVGWVSKGQKIGTIGDSGNAIGKPPHLHYSIVTLIPYFWNIDDTPQGWKKAFYLNPIIYLNKTQK